jgi:hypothetical protein
MCSVALVLALASAAAVLMVQGTLGQQVPLARHTYKNANATDVSSTVAPVTSINAINAVTCMFLCTQDSNCVLAVFRGTSSNCSLYNSAAQSQVISSSGSILYQKQING